MRRHTAYAGLVLAAALGGCTRRPTDADITAAVRHGLPDWVDVRNVRRTNGHSVPGEYTAWIEYDLVFLKAAEEAMREADPAQDEEQGPTAAGPMGALSTPRMQAVFAMAQFGSFDAGEVRRRESVVRLLDTEKGWIRAPKLD